MLYSFPTQVSIQMVLVPNMAVSVLCVFPLNNGPGCKRGRFIFTRFSFEFQSKWTWFQTWPFHFSIVPKNGCPTLFGPTHWLVLPAGWPYLLPGPTSWLALPTGWSCPTGCSCPLAGPTFWLGLCGRTGWVAGPPWWSEHLGGRTTWVAGPRSTRPAGSKHGRFMFRVLPSSNFGQRWTWPQTLLFHSLRASPSKFKQKGVAPNMAVSFVNIPGLVPNMAPRVAWRRSAIP